MVKAKLVDIRVSEWVWAKALWAEIGTLDITAMHKIRGEINIENIRNAIISAVSDALLVHIDEWELENRKNKKVNDARLKYTDDMIWGEWASIRSELMTEWTKIALPRWWTWEDADSTLIGCIYKKNNSEWYEVFVHRDIADNPHGSSVLISEMRRKIKKLKIKSKK